MNFYKELFSCNYCTNIMANKAQFYAKESLATRESLIHHLIYETIPEVPSSVRPVRAVTRNVCETPSPVD